MSFDISVTFPYWKMFLDGLGMTLMLSFFGALLGTFIAIIVTLMNKSNKIFRGIAKFYIWIIRGTPLFVQVMILYYGLPQLGIRMPTISFIPDSQAIIAGIIAISVNSGAYISEIFRAGIESIDKGQIEASRALGLDYSLTMRHIVLPQAIKRILPALGNEFIVLIKESSIVSAVGLRELMFTATLVNARTYRMFESLVVIALLYLFITTILSFALKYFERRLNYDKD